MDRIWLNGFKPGFESGSNSDCTFYMDLPLMDVCDPLDDGKPQTAAVGRFRITFFCTVARPRLVDPIETVEQVGEMLRSDARTGIRDAHPRGSIRSAGFNANPFVIPGRIFYAVFDQVADHLDQVLPVSEDADFGQITGFQPDPVAGGQ